MIKDNINMAMLEAAFINSITRPEIDGNGFIVAKSVLEEEFGLQESSRQYRISYSSTDGGCGEGARADSAVVFLPFGQLPANGWPVIVWAHGTVGIGHDCAPSLNPRTLRDSQYLNTWLSLGFAIIAPDYPGLGSSGLHHYLDARATAWSILDCIRSVLPIFPLENRLILVGQSQGAHAAFSAAGYQREYAPELKIVGTILTGTPYFTQQSSVSDFFEGSGRDRHLTGDPKIPYVFYLYHSAKDRNPHLNATDFFEDSALSLLNESKSLNITILTQLVMEGKINMENSLKSGIQDLLNSCVKKLCYPTLHINHPVFIGIGANDINVPVKMQQRLYNDALTAGTQIKEYVYLGLDHSGAVNSSLRDSVPFALGLKNC